MASTFHCSSWHRSCRLRYQIIPVLWRHFNAMVSWPTIREWNSVRGTGNNFPNAVGCIDLTPHEIQRPQTEPQREFYSAHRHFHLLNTQLICDNRGNIRYLQTRFLGSMHDSQTIRLMEQIGPGLALDVRVNVFFWLTRVIQMSHPC